MNATAVLVGESINLSTLVQKVRYYYDVFHDVYEEKSIVVHRHGVVVFFDHSRSERNAYLETLQKHISQPHKTHEEEKLEVKISRTVAEGHQKDGVLHMKSLNKEKREIIAHLLTKSLLLDRYESRVQDVFASFSPIIEKMRTTPIYKLPKKTIQSLISRNFGLQHSIIGKIKISERPDILWEHESLNKIYDTLLVEYEIHERFEMLTEKISIIDHSAQALMVFLDNHKAHLLEWYIIILIVFEILFTLGEYAGILP